jgi:hypothetical protein
MELPHKIENKIRTGQWKLFTIQSGQNMITVWLCSLISTFM